MARPKSTHCQAGHPWTEETIYTSIDRYGQFRRICAICRRDYVNKMLTLRYRNDPVFREAQKAKARARYYKLKESRA